jgi:hypothetical protein|nr:MAG: hypothetical protein KatS3mg041_1977 [Bacteroidota bacterium]
MAIGLLLALPFWGEEGGACAQSPTRFSERIPRGPEQILQAHLEVVLGRVRLRPGAAEETLFAAEADLGQSGLRPQIQYQLVDGTGRLWLSMQDIDSGRDIRVGLRELFRLSKTHPSWELTLPVMLPLDLELQLAAVEGRLDLGGLSLIRFALESGASSLEIRLERPNPLICESFRVRSGVSSLRAYGLGYARARRYHIEVGLGSLELDFSGSLPEEVEIMLDTGMGRVTLYLPSDRHIEMRSAGGWLERLDLPDGFMRERGRWVYKPPRPSAGTLRLRLQTGMGNILVRWADEKR